MNMKRPRKRKGFTLVEILVVLVIITMLATMIAPNIVRQLITGKIKIAQIGISNIENALSEFYMDCGCFPSQSDSLEALLFAPGDLVEVWNGPYIKESKLQDPFGFYYDYRIPAQMSEDYYDVICYGADGASGGEGENADIYNK